MRPYREGFVTRYDVIFTLGADSAVLYSILLRITGGFLGQDLDQHRVLEQRNHSQMLYPYWLYDIHSRERERETC